MHLHPEDVYLQAIDKENVRPSAYQQPAFLIQPAGKKDGNRPAGMHMTPEKHKDKKRQKSTGYTVRVGWISLCFLVFTAA